MIPRSDRIFFNIDGSPPRYKAKPSHITKSTGNMQVRSEPVPRWNSGQRIPATKHPREVRVPATPWRPRISRKTHNTPIGKQAEDNPSPLNRKVTSSIEPLKLGPKTEPSVLSSAPTSATLAPGCEKEPPIKSDQPIEMKADAYRREPESTAPKLEQREDWQGDRWGLLRSDLVTKMAFQRDGFIDKTNPMLSHEEDRGQPFHRATPFSAYPYSVPIKGAACGPLDVPFYPNTKKVEACLLTDQSNDTNIYVNGLPKEMNDDLLYLLGSACGAVISHKAMMDRQTGLCKGFGFLMYANSDMAKKAIEWLNSHGFTSSFAKESFSARLRRMADASSSNVYLSNLPLKFTVAQLEQLFNPHPIVSLKILYDVHGESRGVGFVRLHDRATAKLCIERLHNRVLPGTTLPLQVRFADSEAQKQLKHSVHQKHTLESLGLYNLESSGAWGEARSRNSPDDVSMHPRGSEDMARIRTASELDAAVARARASLPQPSPFIPMAMSMPSPGTYTFCPPEHLQGIRARTGLGIEFPTPMPWPHFPFEPFYNPSVFAPGPSARVAYPQTESHRQVETPSDNSPIGGFWGTHKQWGGYSETYLPLDSLPPPPGHAPSQSNNYTSDDTASTTTTKTKGAARRVRKKDPAAALRVRFPELESGRHLPEGTRAVSDPMALVAAQTRVKEALNAHIPVRAAVSADNSLEVEAEKSESEGSSEEEEEEEEEEEDSMSVEIRVA